MIENLKKILKQDDTVLFIGSGVSLWSGLPSWKDLINELINFLTANGLDAALTEQESKRGDLLQAASYGFDRLTKQQFADFIRKSCRLGNATPHDIHYKIISIGPKCFITTNYDKLLELSFQKWFPEIYFRTVVNRRLTETAEIVGAKANNFLFKLHGDVEDSDSIILTREQYRALNIGGELYHALETTKILMLSRPILYIGFGLRDPDFLYLKDLLINTYKGGARDHYAIMADVSDQERDYWRRNFGIHLINYHTIPKEDGTKDHSAILDLLDLLKSTKFDTEVKSIKIDSEFILGLNRHAAKYTNFENSKLHLPLVVHPIEKDTEEISNLSMHRYYEDPVEKLLDDGPEKLILIGLPGSGKSYSLKGSVARLAKRLNNECIDDNIKVDKTIIPIYVDLKLYQGSIVDLIEQYIPVGMSIELLCSNFKVKLYLDAFNEIPSEFIESTQWRNDFADLVQQFSFSLVISSRTIDGLEWLKLPSFNLDSIDKDFIKTSLAKNEIELSGLFKNETIYLLQKPFFYKLIFENKIKIESETSPQKIYFDLINLINFKLKDRFQIDIDLLEPLSKAPMDAIESGVEAYKVEVLGKYIELELARCRATLVSPSDIINWLVSQDFLIPIINKRISFFHQSVTEYLAATRLAAIFIENNEILIDKLRYRNWDQALLLTLSQLNKDEADKFIEAIIRADLLLGLSSVKYLESDTKEIVTRLLSEINSKVYEDVELKYSIAFLLQNRVPISECHIPALKKITKKDDVIGGTGVACLLNIRGDDFKNEALAFLVAKCDNYSYCSPIGESLKKYIRVDDLPQLLILCKQVQEKIASAKNKEHNGFNSALITMMADFDLQLVNEIFYELPVKAKKHSVQVSVLCDFLRHCSNSQSLKISLTLLMAGIKNAAFTIHMIFLLSETKENLDYSIFEPEHIKSLLKLVNGKRSDISDWALGALFNICSKRKDLAFIIVKEINESKGVIKAALYYCISEIGEQQLVFDSLEELLDMKPESLSKEKLTLVSCMYELDWRGHEMLAIKLLKKQNILLTTILCDQLNSYNSRESDNPLIFEIGEITWWLSWFENHLKSKQKKEMFLEHVSNFICSNVSSKKKKEFIDEFNNPNSPYRKVLIRIVLKYVDSLTLNDFTSESIAYTLDDLKSRKVKGWEGNILEEKATETFVMNYLLPRLKHAKGVEKANLHKIVESIGRQHKRRYLV